MAENRTKGKEAKKQKEQANLKRKPDAKTALVVDTKRQKEQVSHKRKFDATLNSISEYKPPVPKISKGEKTLSTKQDLERYFGRPLDEEANQLIDAGKQDLTIIPTVIEDAVMGLADEIIDRPGEFLDPNKWFAKMLRKRKNDEVYGV